MYVAIILRNLVKRMLNLNWILRNLNIFDWYPTSNMIELEDIIIHHAHIDVQIFKHFSNREILPMLQQFIWVLRVKEVILNQVFPRCSSCKICPPGQFSVENYRHQFKWWHKVSGALMESFSGIKAKSTAVHRLKHMKLHLITPLIIKHWTVITLCFLCGSRLVIWRSRMVIFTLSL